ncbi:hypothetical protein D3C80_968770 [compost metagenome]
MGQAVGLGVQLGVGHALAFAGQRDGLRALGGAGFEQLVQHRRNRLRLELRVPALQQLVTRLRGDQRQLADAALRVGHHRVQQVLPVLGQALDAAGVEQVGGVGQAGVQGVALLLGVQRQVELGAVLAPVEAFHLEARQLALDALAQLLLVVVEHLEQRAVVEAALRLQGFHQLLEGQFLMGLGAQGGLADLLQQRAERLLAVHFGTQHLGVDEEADQAFGFQARTAGVGHADADVALAAEAVQQGLVAGQQEHEQGHLLLLGAAAQAGHQLGRQAEFQARAALAAPGRAGQFAGQFQQRLAFAQLRLPPVQLARALAGIQPVALPAGVVGVAHRQRRQVGRAAFHAGLIELGELFHHQLHGPAVGGDVVHGEHQYVFIGRHLQ